MEESKFILTLERAKEELIREKLLAINTLIKQDGSIAAKHLLTKYAELISKRFTLEFMNRLTNEEIYVYIRNRFMTVESCQGKNIHIVVKRFLPDFPEKSNGSMVLDMVIKDHPFIIDSLTEYLHEKRYNMGLIYYNVMEMEFSADKKLVSLQKGADDAPKSFTNVSCILNKFDPAASDTLMQEVQMLMEMVGCVTDDFEKITESIDEYTVKPEKGTSESLIESERRHLFAWFNAGNVILLGGGEVAKEDISSDLTWDKIEKPMGYVRRKKELNDQQLPRDVGRYGWFFLESGLKINLIETTELSEVHKKERIQILFGRKKNSAGVVKVNFYHVLFTNKSLKEDALSIPLARLKVNSILDAHFEHDNTGGRSGHMTKMANDFFSIIPKRELFRLDRHELEAIYNQFLYFGDYQQTRVSIYSQPSRNYARITFCMPSHRFSPIIFDRIDAILTERLGIRSEMKYWFSLARNSYSHHLFWFPKDHSQLENIDVNGIEREVASLTMGWEDEFKALLNSQQTEKSGYYLSKYSEVFTTFYQAVYSPKDAIIDIEFLEALLTTKRDQVDLRTAPYKDESIIYIFSLREYNLTEVMPHLQNMALIVTDENTYYLNIAGQQVYIYTYYVKELKQKEKLYPHLNRDFCELLLAVLEARTEDDVLNGLLLAAGLNLQEINLFILYRNYYWQIGAPYLPVNKSFLDNPEVIIALRDFFYAKFKPRDNAGLNEQELKAWKEKTYKVIYGVKTVAEDIIFKTILNLMEATVRTNFFAIDAASAMAIKIRSADVEQMPVPKPLFEIYVHGTQVEGIHMRGAMIARGGIRFSDRHDDFRTEVLGLMNTQMLKNVVIVPEGSKGGFISKRVFSDIKQRRADAVEQYRRYINSLLSLTDNIVEGVVVPPEGLIRYDGDDPYLVVAADKGTATYSDVANEISQSRKFWLDDAFASGGKHGYDHKGMGITAKGAWEGVKFHFLELGIDIQTTDFQVVGIGDMSGDVFGNGMLLSKKIQLVGAFNHIHIFVDPNPDSELSWTERERLFKTPGSTWKDYDPKLISAGGGVFDRSAKTIPLTPEIQKLLGVTLETVSGEEMIKLLLQARVDLLWNGGIGTYVKATTETVHEVGDAANDAVRINASQLRIKVIGEGGNLGLTQLARLEAAAKGIKLNTDAIDNSGGVDTSDHEVNLKIMMRALKDDGQIASFDERNKLLVELTDEIADLVLADNRGQVQIISMDNLRSKKDIKPFLDLIRILVEKGVMDPRTGKTSSSEQLANYFSNGLGVPRPDLSLLLSYTKMYFYKEIVKSEQLDDPFLAEIYLSYFPESFKKRYDLTNVQHPLKKEIIGTVLVNKTINQAGITILPEILSIIDTSPSSIIIAYTIIDQLFEMQTLRKGIMKELKTANLKHAYELKIKLEQLITDTIIWMLFSYNATDLRFSLANTFFPFIKDYRAALDHSLDSDDQLQLESASKEYLGLGISPALAREIALLDFMRNSFEVILQAQKSELKLEDAVVLSQAIDRMFHFQVLHNRIMSIDLDSVWVKRHRGLLMQQLQILKQQVSDTIVNRFEGKSDYDEKLAEFMKANRQPFKQYQIEYNQIVNSESVELSGIAILLDRIRQLIS